MNLARAWREYHESFKREYRDRKRDREAARQSGSERWVEPCPQAYQRRRGRDHTKELSEMNERRKAGLQRKVVVVTVPRESFPFSATFAACSHLSPPPRA